MSAAPRSRHIEIQARDLEVLRGLFESRVMTAEHVAALYFEGRYEAARKRLQGLKAAGYVGQRPRRAYEPAVLFLTRKAFELLCERGAITDYPPITWTALEKRVRVSELTLRHELDVMTVKAAVCLAVSQAPAFEVVEFSTWPLLYQFEAMNPAGEQVTVKPDGLIRIQERAEGGGERYEYTLFLEVDRSTETQEILAHRVACYLDYYRRGGLAARHGRPREEYKAFPFRVLMTFRNAERRNNAAGRLLRNRPPVLTMAWMTTLAEVTSNPLGAIWVRPLDLREATRGSTYDVSRVGESAGYRRQSEREALVERHLTKMKLLEGDGGGLAPEFGPPSRG